ncbi:MAG: AAA family ATPase [Candidatus Aenigmarchaeota archaeon]|nr:AAA family ATPase [Candidatus Aenigmarchaeota archaeon]
MLYLVCGLPGTGKTTVAKELSSLTGGIVLRTDEIRKQLLSNPQYTPEEKRLVYDAMLRTAGSMLRAGALVILDATFHLRKEREAAKDMAGKAGSGHVMIEVRCDERTVREHLRKRRVGADESDADFGVYKKIEQEWEPLKGEHHVIDISEKNWRKDLKGIVVKG